MNTMITNDTTPIAVAANPVAKVVTTHDIAEKLGIPRGTVAVCLSNSGPKECSASKVDLVRRTAKEMGYNPQMALDAGRKRRSAAVTMNDIAEKCGCSVMAVSRALSAKSNGKDAEKIRTIAKDLGYTNPFSYEAKVIRQKKKEEEYLRTHNFPSREAETKRMMALHEQGYSNKEIASKVGRCPLTVRRRIGAQPEDMSLANRILGQKNRAARNAQRKQYVADHTINVYNGLVTQLDQVNDKITELSKSVVTIGGQLKAMVPEVEKAAKISKVEVKSVNLAAPVDLTQAVPTPTM